MDAYEVLGVKRSDSKEYIRDRYRKLCKAYHPDAGGDPEKFMAVQNAWEQISQSKLQRVEHRKLQHKSVFDFGATI